MPKHRVYEIYKPVSKKKYHEVREAFDAQIKRSMKIHDITRVHLLYILHSTYKDYSAAGKAEKVEELLFVEKSN